LGIGGGGVGKCWGRTSGTVGRSLGGRVEGSVGTGVGVCRGSLGIGVG